VVNYDGGYPTLPADLRAVFLELARRQLTAMGVDLAALGGTSGAGLPVKSVSIGQLRVDYAQATGSSASAATRGPLSGETLEEFATVLDLYRHPRRVVATP
jgi:hypothetical protein